MKRRSDPAGWLFVLPLMLGGRQAQAQDWNDFHFKKVFGEVGLGLELWDEQRVTAGSEKVQREVIPRLAISAGTLGYFYHPKFVELDLRGTLQLEQQWVFVEGPQSDQSFTNIFPDWDLRATFFKDHPYFGDVYSQRAETWTRQSFFPTIRSTFTETGANFGAREWIVPTNFHYHHYTFDTRGVATQDEVRDTLSMGGGTSTGPRTFNYVAEYNSVQLKGRNQSYDDFRANASSRHLLGSDRKVSWQNRVSLREQVGDLNTSHRAASSGLNSRFTPNLDGDTRLEFDHFDSESSYTQTLGWRGQLRHRLYRSLASSANFRLQRTSVAGGAIGLNGLGGSLEYNKDVPGGHLGLRYSLQYYIQDQDDLQGQADIFEEPHVYTLGVPIILENHSVDESSVIITDATGLTLYTEGLDYFLIPDGSLLRVEITIGSLILPGQTILVSYNFQPSPAHSFADTAHTTGLDFSYGDIADLRLGYQTTDQDLISGTDPGSLTDSVTTTADFQVHPLASTLGAHYRKFESDFAPYERRSVRFSLNKPIWTRSMWQIQAENYRTEFLDNSGSENGSSIRAFVTTSVGGTSILEARVEAFKVNYLVDKGDGYSAEFGWRRRIRDLEISLRVRYLDEQFETATDQEIASLFFTLTRRF